MTTVFKNPKPPAVEPNPPKKKDPIRLKVEKLEKQSVNRENEAHLNLLEVPANNFVADAAVQRKEPTEEERDQAEALRSLAAAGIFSDYSNETPRLPGPGPSDFQPRHSWWWCFCGGKRDHRAEPDIVIRPATPQNSVSCSRNGF